MPPLIVLGFVVLVLAMLGLSWVRRNPGVALGPLTQKAMIGVGVFILLALTLTGRLHWLITLVGLGIPLILRGLAIARVARSARGPTPGRTSDVETRFLRMSLDHDSGEMGGEVLEGPYRGRRLDDMTLDELVELLAQCRSADPSSVELLETYLDRAHGDAWRAEGGEPRDEPSSAAGLTRDDALEILGLHGEPTDEEIIEAHRRLMQKLHPDRGGSSYLASQVNRAKDLLLDM